MEETWLIGIRSLDVESDSLLVVKFLEEKAM
jgi:hypothetical protein